MSGQITQVKKRNGFTAQQCIEAVKDSGGFMTTIANQLGCTRSYVYQLEKKYVTFAQAIEDEHERQKDRTEHKLFEAIEDGNMTGIIFYLKTQAKDRGYIEKIDLNIQMEREFDKIIDHLQQRLESPVYQKVIEALASD